MEQVDGLAVLLCVDSQEAGHRALPETGVKSRHSFADHGLASEARSNFCDGHRNGIGATLSPRANLRHGLSPNFPYSSKKGLLVLAGLGAFGCEQKPAAQAPPPPMVTVAKPIKKEIVEWLNFTAQTQAVDTVTVIPRVTGYIDNITFKEGDIVDFGDLLFVIDPRPYQAALDEAKGQLEQAAAEQS